MRTLLLHILFLAISCQPSAFSQNSMVLDQKPEANILSSMVNGLSSTAKSQKPYVKNNNSVDYYESQIRLADSLYKNYLPQYNFDEVKKAVAFFEESPSKDNSRNSATQQLIDSLSHRLIDSDFLRAKAHYYHAVGLTEKDDVVGACEHYLHALEIMEPLVGTSPLLRPKTNDKGLKANDKRQKANDKSSTAKSQKPKVKKNKTVDCCQLSVDNPQDYEKIRFVSLIYTRLGQLFNNENYCSLAILKYKKALYYVETLGNNDSKSHILNS